LIDSERRELAEQVKSVLVCRYNWLLHSVLMQLFSVLLSFF